VDSDQQVVNKELPLPMDYSCASLAQARSGVEGHREAGRRETAAAGGCHPPASHARGTPEPYTLSPKTPTAVLGPPVRTVC